MKTVPTYISELPEDYQNLYGLWKVTTEGDEEGRTTKSLGIYEGWVDEIALYLSDKCYYSLTFTAYHINKVPVSSNYIKKDKAQVNVKFNIDSKTWDLSAHDRAKLISNLFAANNRANVKIEVVFIKNPDTADIAIISIIVVLGIAGFIAYKNRKKSAWLE